MSQFKEPRTIADIFGVDSEPGSSDEAVPNQAKLSNNRGSATKFRTPYIPISFRPGRAILDEGVDPLLSKNEGCDQGDISCVDVRGMGRPEKVICYVCMRRFRDEGAFGMSNHHRAVQCELCGKQFFPSSLPFHQKQCVVRQQFLELPCPHCDTLVRSWQMGHHLSRECKSKQHNKALKSTIICPIEKDVPKAGGVACSVCGRRFSADRLGTHQKICRRAHQGDDLPVIKKTKPLKTDSTSLIANSVIAEPAPWRSKREDMKRMMRTHKQRVNEVDFQLVLEPEHSDSKSVETVLQAGPRDSRSPSICDSLYETDSLEGNSPKFKTLSSLADEKHPEMTRFDLRDPIAIINAADGILADFHFLKIRRSPMYFAPRTGRYSYTSSCQSTPDNTVIFN